MNIIPNENLIAEGIPAIPASLADEVARYTETRSATLASWHPTRREMLILTRFADTPQVHQVRFPGGDRRQLTFFPDRVLAALYPPVDDDYFIFQKDVGGGEFFQFYRYDLGTGTVTLLTDGASRNTDPVWSPDGKLFAYASTRRNRTDTDIYIMDPTDPATDRCVLEVQGGGWDPFDFSPDGSRLLLREYISINESYLWLLGLTTGEKRLLTPKADGAKVAYGAAKFTKDGRGILATCDAHTGFLDFVGIDPETGEQQPLLLDAGWDVEKFALSSDGAYLAYSINEAGRSVLRVRSLKDGKEAPLPTIPGGVITALEWRHDSSELGFSLTSARTPGDAFSVDVTTGHLERWTESETGGLNVESLPEAELVRWSSFDGREITGFLYRPPATFSGKRPVIINIHGGPEGQSRPGFIARNNYPVAELGVAVLFPNVRGSAGFGRDFLLLDNGYQREDSVRDIGALLDWIAAQPDLDPDRVMVTGGSYGGYMTLAVATHYNDRIRCSMDIVGISNFVTFLENTESYRRDLRRAEYGDERDPEMRKFLLSIAPVNNVHKIQKPMFVVQGANDPRVPLSEAEQMVKAIRENGSPVWYLIGKDEGHGFIKKKNVDFWFYATIEFIRQNLLAPEPTP